MDTLKEKKFMPRLRKLMLRVSETYASGLGNLCLGSPDIRYDQSYKWLKRYRGENSAPSETQPCALALASRL